MRHPAAARLVYALLLACAACGAGPGDGAAGHAPSPRPAAPATGAGPGPAADAGTGSGTDPGTSGGTGTDPATAVGSDAGTGVDPGVDPGVSTSPPGSPSPAPVRGRRNTLSCGASTVTLPGMPAGLSRAGSFDHLPELGHRLAAHGHIWRAGDEHLYVGVLCGVRGAERFATLVPRSTLIAYKGRPALRWNTRDGLRNLMWLERPGIAVYIGATPGLTPHIKSLAAGVG
ncbi:MAG TPA: hypothetical protein VFV66_05465 [Nonomuraea sp.]|nr:hypothetical protein [Nonomuraea sp.]